MTDTAPWQLYLGTLPDNDPLYDLLAREIQDALGFDVARPIFDVFALDWRGVAFRYKERQSGADLACKFYGNRHDSGGRVQPWRAAELLQREYDNLLRARSLGLVTAPQRVVRPLTIVPTLNAALVMEYVGGPNLDVFLKAAIADGQTDELAARLADLARFLSVLHRRSTSWQPVDRAAGPAYLTRLVSQLVNQGVINSARALRLECAGAAWAYHPRGHAAFRSLIHGDVTPVNVVFGPDGEVVALDLERLREDDPAADLGMVIGELTHAFLRGVGSTERVVPLAEVLMGTYAQHGGLSGEHAAALAERMRPYIGTSMLRICRNDWLDGAYRRVLSEEAERWLV